MEFFVGLFYNLFNDLEIHTRYLSDVRISSYSSLNAN